MISIVVPCYNCEKFLYTAVESLLNQSIIWKAKTGQISEKRLFSDRYQIILVDDGSSDNTSAICDTYAAKYNEKETDCGPWVKVVHQKNGGLMNAWKRGVLEADGDYIAFCDADDFVDPDLVERIESIVAAYHPDMILYGMIIEYNNGEKVKKANLLAPGLYNRNRIECEVFPHLYSNGTMQSELIAKSRCSKVFRKTLLQQIMPDLDDGVSTGEDDITTFAAILNADKLYCIGEYYPYHYLRNNESMIGSYDPGIFDKFEQWYENKRSIALKYNYVYMKQLEADYMSQYILYIKKDICRTPGSIAQICNRLAKIRETDAFISLAGKTSFEGYKVPERIFAYMFLHRWYLPMVFITRWIDKKRGRNV